MRKRWSGAVGGCSIWDQVNKCIFIPNSALVLQIPKQTHEDIRISGYLPLI